MEGAENQLAEFNAAPSALGYIYQYEVGLLEFLRRDDPSLELSIELLDDVAFEGEQTELMQAKYRVRPGNLTDGSAELWKTLRVWSEGVAALPDAALVLVSTANAPDGSIAALLRADANRDTDVAYELLVMYAQSTSSTTLASARGAFLGVDDERRRELVERIVISDGSPSFEDLDEEFRRALRLAAPLDRRDALATRLREWWLARSRQHLVEVAGGGHPRISAAEIEGRLGDLRDELAADNLPIDFEEIEPPGSVDAEDQRHFIMQLRLIALANERIRNAVHDHNRAFHQRSRWLRDDLVDLDELRRYESRLREEWQRLWLPETDETEEVSDVAAEERGRDVFLS
jgi:hypothetical protein